MDKLIIIHGLYIYILINQINKFKIFIEEKIYINKINININLNIKNNYTIEDEFHY